MGLTFLPYDNMVACSANGECMVAILMHYQTMHAFAVLRYYNSGV